MADMAAILDFQSEQFQLFFIYKLPQYFCHFKSIGLSVQQKQSKTDFQDGHHGNHLAFLIGMILAIFSRFESTGLLVKEKSKIDFLDGRHFRSERFQLCLINKSPRCHLPSFESIGLGV